MLLLLGLTSVGLMLALVLMLAWNNERMRRYRCRVGVAYSELPSLVEAFLAPCISLQILETYLVLNRHTIKEEDFLVLHNSLMQLGSVSEHSNQGYMAACLVLPSLMEAFLGPRNSLQTLETYLVLNRHTIKEEDFLVLHNNLTR
jgi:hypothetical protein